MTRREKLKKLAELKLERLSKQLKMSGIPPQTVIARAVGVDQPVVSRARNGELRRLTPRVEELARYVNMRVRELGLSQAPVRKRVHGARGQTNVEALKTCREYLRQGCDPNVLIDQVAILRRAQRPGVSSRGEM